MALSVIGAGLGRTGTMSLKLALEALGFGPCHHMVEVIRNPGQAELWSRAFDGEAVDWDEAFEGYRSSVDWPSAAFWRELAEHYPDAKVVLTVRDSLAWFDSIQATIFNDALRDSGHIPAPVAAMMEKIKATEVGEARHDMCDAVLAFEAHVAAVEAAIPPERLLLFNVSWGWEPLCDFLGVEVPAGPFPKANTTEEFVARIEAMRAGKSGF